ncbi:CHAD domain-containing protein [Parathalassolituus penaei]|uniref:CHAD domain-containing protein n=1 Tax=Parathalassolituus penaei TaxID=2997323 RepID=A0A9X3EGA8_9GAMM|nr:CHAD domain-containing protein [Parathalassolituus penaei]MCY0967037.1 CHAD domain-containing protein [Parathalassolituus penaei]
MKQSLEPRWSSFCASNQRCCDDVLAWLVTPVDADRVHAIRLVCKTLRASWQWLQTDADTRRIARQRGRVLAQVAALLADHREQQVMADWLQQLSDKSTGSQRLALGYAKRRLLTPISEALTLDVAGLELVFRDEMLLWRNLARQSVSKRWWQTGYQRCWQKAADLAADACLNDNSLAYHSWRKWVKYELLVGRLVHIESLARDSGRKAGAYWQQRQTGLHQLASQLGDFHDLCVLRQRIQALEFSRKVPAWPQQVVVVLDAEMEQLKCALAGQRLACYELQEPQRHAG